MLFQCFSRAFLTSHVPHCTCPRVTRVSFDAEWCPASLPERDFYSLARPECLIRHSRSSCLRNLPPRRDTRDAQDVYPLPPALFAIFAPETIARRWGNRPPLIWMEDNTRDTRDARKSAVGQWVNGVPRFSCPISSCVPSLCCNGYGARVTGTRHA